MPILRPSAMAPSRFGGYRNLVGASSARSRLSACLRWARNPGTLAVPLRTRHEGGHDANENFATAPKRLTWGHWVYISRESATNVSPGSRRIESYG